MACINRFPHFKDSCKTKYANDPSMVLQECSRSSKCVVGYFRQNYHIVNFVFLFLSMASNMALYHLYQTLFFFILGFYLFYPHRVGTSEKSFSLFSYLVVHFRRVGEHQHDMAFSLLFCELFKRVVCDHRELRILESIKRGHCRSSVDSIQFEVPEIELPAIYPREEHAKAAVVST